MPSCVYIKSTKGGPGEIDLEGGIMLQQFRNEAYMYVHTYVQVISHACMVKD